METSKQLLKIDVKCLQTTQDASGTTLRLVKVKPDAPVSQQGTVTAEFVANILSEDKQLAKLFDADEQTQYQITITKT